MKTRQQIITEAKRQRDELTQYFNDVSDWNNIKDNVWYIMWIIAVYMPVKGWEFFSYVARSWLPKHLNYKKQN